MAFKGKESLNEPGAGSGMTEVWTFETRELLERFSAILEGRGLAHEIRNKAGEPAKGPDGLVIAVAESDYREARRLLLRHRKRRSSADRH
jgi:hypothetical protein